MNVNPATISIMPECITFRNHTPRNGIEIEKDADIGTINEKVKQGTNMQINKGKLNLMDHFLIKMSERYIPQIK